MVIAIIKNEIDRVFEQFCQHIFSTGSYGLMGFSCYHPLGFAHMVQEDA